MTASSRRRGLAALSGPRLLATMMTSFDCPRFWDAVTKPASGNFHCSRRILTRHGSSLHNAGPARSLSAIWVCPSKYAQVQKPYFQRRLDVWGRPWTRCRCLWSRRREFKSRRQEIR
jgi:hypothetical protein